MRFVCVLFCSLMVSTALCQNADDHSNLAGKWQIDPARSDGTDGITLNIQVNSDDSIHYRRDTQAGGTAEFTCTTDGKECDMTDAGHKAKISLWYNGSALVMMETKGNNVLKRKLTVTGATLEMQVIPIVPQGRTDKLIFIKQS